MASTSDGTVTSALLNKIERGEALNVLKRMKRRSRNGVLMHADGLMYLSDMLFMVSNGNYNHVIAFVDSARQFTVVHSNVHRLNNHIVKSILRRVECSCPPEDIHSRATDVLNVEGSTCEIS